MRRLAAPNQHVNPTFSTGHRYQGLSEKQAKLDAWAICEIWVKGVSGIKSKEVATEAPSIRGERGRNGKCAIPSQGRTFFLQRASWCRCAYSEQPLWWSWRNRSLPTLQTCRTMPQLVTPFCSIQMIWTGACRRSSWCKPPRKLHRPLRRRGRHQPARAERAAAVAGFGARDRPTAGFGVLSVAYFGCRRFPG